MLRFWRASSAIALTALLATGCAGNGEGTAEGDDSTTEPEATTEADGVAASTEESDATPVASDDEMNGECLDPTEAVPVTIGIRPSLVFADIYLAEHLGYFEDQGVDVSLEAVEPATALQLVSSGDVDAVATGLTAGLFNAIGSGLDLYPATPGGNDSAETATQFWVRTDLVESGEVEEVADLEGRRFAMPGIIGAGASQKTALYLASGDLTLTDVELVNLGYPDMPGAFENGSIDAAYVTAGASDPIVDADSARPFGQQDITVDENTNTVVFGPTLVDERPEVGTAVLHAMMRAREDLQGAYWQDSDLVSQLSEATDIEVDVIEETARASLPADLAFTPDSWEKAQEIYLEAGVLDTEVKPFEEVVAPEMREAALASYEQCVQG